MHIDMWADVTCPWSYLGIRHLRQALAECVERDEVEVALHAYFLDPELEDTPHLSHSEYLQKLGVPVDEVEQYHERLRALGRQEGVVFDFENLVVAPTSNAHRVIAAAHDIDVEADTVSGPDSMQVKLYETLGRAHLEMGLNIADPDVIIGCGQDIGIDAKFTLAALTDERWASQIFSDYQIGIQMGIDRIPTYLFDRQLVVQDHQPLSAMRNIVKTAWEQSRRRTQ